MAVAKEVIKRVNDMVPELGYQGGLYTFAPYGAVVNQGRGFAPPSPPASTA